MLAVQRGRHLRNLQRLLRENPVVALLGARQVGKTTLAQEVMRRQRGAATRFDLEDPRDLRQLDEPTLALAPLRGLVVLDEIQQLVQATMPPLPRQSAALVRSGTCTKLKSGLMFVRDDQA